MVIDMAMSKKFVRTKTFYCGGSKNSKAEYVEQDLFYMYESKKVHHSRNAKTNMSTPKQQNLNDKYSKRYCLLLAKTNFHVGDYAITLTYQDKYLPSTFEEGQKDIKNYVRRVKSAAKKKGCEVRYLYVTEQGALHGRIHFHMLINRDCGLTRDELEALWKKQYRKNQGMDKDNLAMGYVNVKVLQDSEGGIEAAVRYMLKYDRNTKGRRVFNASHNLQKPQTSNNDNKISNTKYEQLCMFTEGSEAMVQYFEQTNPGYEVVSVERVFYEDNTSFSICAKMRLKAELRKKQKKLSTTRKKKGDKYAPK